MTATGASPHILELGSVHRQCRGFDQRLFGGESSPESYVYATSVEAENVPFRPKGVTTLFATTQALLALANGGDAPAILMRTDSRGVPYVAVLTASSLGASAYLSLQESTITAFWWLVSLSSAAGLVSWCVLCYGHIKLMQGMRVQGYSREGMSIQKRGNP